MKDSMVARISGRKNAKLFSTLDELQDYINTLVSKVNEGFIKSIRDSAAAFFFSPESDKGFIDKEKIVDRIRSKFSDKLAEYPSNADYRENGTWTVWPPSFVKKERQRITWRTAVQVDAKALKSLSTLSAWNYGQGVTGPLYGQVGVQLPISSNLVPENTWTRSATGPTGPSGGNPLDIYGMVDPVYRFSTGLGPQPLNLESKKLVANGHSTFHIMWSVTITARKKFMNAKIATIDFIETVWE